FEVEAKDTTGAGDCFVAGYLAALRQDAAPEKAGRFANAVAALSVERLGGAAGVVPSGEVERWMRQAQLRRREPPG
ncbi:MAG: PfkB family carbohydrate kinase, partial [Opitutales bacterium]